MKNFFMLILLVLFQISCSDSKFGGTAKSNVKNSKSGSNGMSAGENSYDKGKFGNGNGDGNGSGSGSNGESNADGTGKGTGFGGDGTIIVGEAGDVTSIASKGKSLDLYAIFDVSGSLEKNDPNCIRFQAFAGFLGKLKTYLGDKTDVRLSLITFSSDVRNSVTLSNVLSMDLAVLNANSRGVVCSNGGETNPKAAFDKVLSLNALLETQNKKESKSVLFFTDGFPSLKDGFPNLTSIIGSSDSLNAAFNSRVFGVMLGANMTNSAPCNVLEAGCKLTPEGFIQSVVKNKSNFRNVLTSPELADALLSFFK